MQLPLKTCIRNDGSFYLPSRRTLSGKSGYG